MLPALKFHGQMRAFRSRRVKDRPLAGRAAARVPRVLETPGPEGKLAAMNLRLKPAEFPILLPLREKVSAEG